MCLILVAWRTQPEHPLVVAANRDEFQGGVVVDSAGSELLAVMPV